MAVNSNETQQTGAQLVVRVLEAQGVTHVFGIPGAKIDAVWSSVVKAGATILGPLRADLGVWHTSDLPTTQWLPETGIVTPSDVTLRASVLTPRRVAAQTIFSRQLFVQASPAADKMIARDIGRALSQTLDAACLYGRGPTQNEPLGVLATPGTNQVPFTGSIWENLIELRRSCLDHDVDPDSYGLLSSPNNEARLLTSAQFGTASDTVWHGLRDLHPSFFSPEVNDNRFFGAPWTYLVIALFGGTATEPGLDLILNDFSRADRGQIEITANLWCDCAITWPETFAYSEPDPLPLKNKK